MQDNTCAPKKRVANELPTAHAVIKKLILQIYLFNSFGLTPDVSAFLMFRSCFLLIFLIFAVFVICAKMWRGVLNGDAYTSSRQERAVLSCKGIDCVLQPQRWRAYHLVLLSLGQVIFLLLLLCFSRLTLGLQSVGGSLHHVHA